MMFGTKKADRRVQKLLDILELKYSIDQDGDFKVIVEFNDGRSQVAFIDSNTQELDDFEIREIWSIAYVSEGFLDIDTANTLLLNNHQLKMGAWRLMPGGNNTFLVAFCIQIAANSDPDSFEKALKLVLMNADNMEEKLTGEDRL